jgi:molybdopterin-guanine dinucleotide biosynthesis protein A
MIADLSKVAGGDISNITGIVMAGGKSQRMGVDKGLMMYQGQHMVTYSIQILSALFTRVVISTSNPDYKVFNLETIPDIYPGSGPLGGLYSCLSQSNSEVNVCLPCDLPFMKSHIIEQLLESYDGKSCVIPLTPLPEPLVAVYPLSVLPVLKELIEKVNYRMTDIFRNFPVRYISLREFKGTDNHRYFANINSPGDIK